MTVWLDQVWQKRILLRIFSAVFSATAWKIKSKLPHPVYCFD